MNRPNSGGKRAREASRDLRKKQKEERLRRNRELRAQGLDPDVAEIAEAAPPLPEVKLEDVVIGVASQSRRHDMGPVKLFVGGLSSRTTAADLRAAFAKFGDLVDATIVADRGTAQSRGFGFVSYASGAAANSALAGMNGVEIDGRMIRVDRAETRS